MRAPPVPNSSDQRQQDGGAGRGHENDDARRHRDPLAVGLGLGLLFGVCVALASGGPPARPRASQDEVLSRSTLPWRRLAADLRVEDPAGENPLIPYHEVPATCYPDTGWTGVRTVKRLAALQHVNADLPASIQTGPQRGMVFVHDADVDDAEVIPAACDEVTVVVVNDAEDRCLLLAETTMTERSFHIHRFDRSAPDTWTPLSRIFEGKQKLPKEGTRKHGHQLLKRLLAGLEDVKAKLEPVLAQAAKHTPDSYREASVDRGGEFKGAVLIMCMNEGNIDLFFNFLLSACARGLNVDNLVVFAADDRVDAALRLAGVPSFTHEALGRFNTRAARSYGDHTFVEMMWLKTTCVYLANSLGYDVFFQDADLFWWSDPWLHFAARPEIDTIWMDDGARTSRFAPHFMNTGFYLIRANRRTALFTSAMLGLHDVVLAYQSHQSVVSQLAAEHHSLHGMSVQILDREDFASGKQLHHNKPMFEKISKKTWFPVVFHMCWTAGKDDKLKFLKQENLWDLPSECSIKNIGDAALSGDAKFIRRCTTCNKKAPA